MGILPPACAISFTLCSSETRARTSRHNKDYETGARSAIDGALRQGSVFACGRGMVDWVHIRPKLDDIWRGAVDKQLARHHRGNLVNDDSADIGWSLLREFLRAYSGCGSDGFSPPGSD